MDFVYLITVQNFNACIKLTYENLKTNKIWK